MKESKLKTQNLFCVKSNINLKLSALSIFIFSPLFMLAQLSGIWYGELQNDSTHRKQSFEIGLSEYKGKITGFTYTTFISNDTFYFSVKRIKAERKDSLLVVVDDEMLYNNFPERAAKGVKQTTTFPLINDSTIDITKGRWSTNQTKRYYSLYGSAAVKEVEDIKESELVSHLDEIKVKNNLAVRTPKEQQTAIVKTSMPGKTKPKQNSATDNKKESKTSSLAVNNTAEKKQTEKKIPESDQTKSVAVNNTSEMKANSGINNTGPSNNSDLTLTQKTPTNNQQQKSTENIHSGGTSNATVQKQNNIATQQSNNSNSVVKSNPDSKVSVAEVKSESKTADVAANKPKKDSTVKKELPQDVAVRKSATVQNLYFHSDSLILSLYDNGIVDGDTVSVFMNGEPIFSKQMLKATATKKTIYITPDMDSVQIVLFADNLGTIPPNTGLLTVRDGDNVYNVRFSADLQNNAAIVLRRKR